MHFLLYSYLNLFLLIMISTIRKTAFFIFLFALACNPPEQVEDAFSSPKNLFVAYVSSYTSGIISSNAEIKVTLAKKAAEAVPGEKVQEKVLSFEPSIAGDAYWEDAFTIAFRPEGKLEAGRKYKATLQLDKLIETPKEKREFRFVFQVMPQNYEVKLEDLAFYDVHTLNKVKLHGTVQTADQANRQAMEKVVSAKQGGQELKITWSHGDANLHRFVIEDVARGDRPEEVHIAWNGTPIGVDKAGSTNYSIPALSDFKVMSAKINQGEENYISVHFSDPLQINQNLNGLVQLHETRNAPRVVVNQNELKIYPASALKDEINLTLYKSIKSITGKSLEADFSTSLQFIQQNPAVRLSLKHNAVILPGSEGLVLPFEAVGLKAVDVTVVRIYEENVLQYLQVNNLGGSNEIKRVGRPVAQKVVPLNASGVVDLNEWNRFTLDLAEIMEAEPGAIYQVSINFRKSQSLYFCADTDNEIADDEISLGNWDDPDLPSYWDYYDYNYDDYNWSQRNNPCSNSYYYNKSVNKVLFASDLGIIAKRSDNGNLHVFTTNLLTTDPVQSEITVYDFQQQPIGQASSNVDGVAEIEVTGTPFTLVAKNGDQTGYLKLSDGSSLSLSNFDVSGQTIQKGIKGFIYGERGVWRPGDTLHLSFILEDKQKLLPANHPVILELFNPKGQLETRRVRTEGVGNMYGFSIPTASEVLTGNWQAKVKVGGAEFSERVKIETVKPNRLKISLDFGKDKITALEKEIAGNLNVRWLHGAKARNLRTQIELLLTPATTSFKGYPGYSFDDASKEFFSESQVVFDGRIDAEGKARMNTSIYVGDRAPGALNAVFKAKAFEEGGDFSIDQFNIPYYPYTSFVGLKAPEGDRNGLLLTDEDHTIKIASVDANGNPINRDRIKVSVYKLHWRWWWDNSHEDLSNYVGRSYQTPVTEGYLSTKNGEGNWKFRIDHPAWGRYYIKVTDPVSGHSAGQIVAVDWPGWATGTKEGLDGVTMLSFAPEKSEYQVGEKVKISIPSSAGGRALVSLESGSKVLKSFWVPTNEGSTLVEFDAAAEMAPNIYAHIMLIQPHAQTLNDLPIRLYGVQSIAITDPNTKLEPVIKMADELRPEAPFTVTVSEKSGKPMAYTLAVVEEGLLDITRFKTPAPWSHFYAREALGVKTWDMYDGVIGAFGGNLERLLAIGGDDELKAPETTEVNRFKPVVKYLGPFYLDKGKTANHQLDMPQYIGSVRTMVVAAHEGAYGSAEVTTPVKQPLMVLATLPRVAGPGEEIYLPVNIFTTNANLKQVKVEVKTAGLLNIVGAAQKTVQFNQPGDQVVYFNLKSAEALGSAKVVVTATSGNFKATYDVEMNVRASNPSMVDVQDKLVASKTDWQVSYSPVGIEGTNEGVIEFSTMPPLNLEQRMQFLVQYPHGCAEQITSTAFAQLFLNKLTDVSQERNEKIEQNVNYVINRLLAYQLPSGGLAYWPGQTTPHAWATSYGGHFLLEAKAQGYHVPDGLLSSWTNFQQRQAEEWTPGYTTGQSDLIQAYRLYTLALAGKPALGAMNRMKERDNSTAAQWRLALAYVVAGHEAEAQKLIGGLSTEVKNYRELGYTFGSQQRDQAMILETLVRLGDNEKAFVLLKDIAEYMGNADNWMSTQTTAYTLMGIAKYAEKYALNQKMDVKVKVNNREVPLSSESAIAQIFLQSPDQPQQISVENSGASPVYVRLISNGVPLTGEEHESARNINLTVRYTNANGEEIPVESIKQGTDFRATVTIHNTSLGQAYQELALTQIFPSGWEIINTRLDDTQQYYNQGKPNYQDIRDDRVYTYFDLKANERKTFSILLNASYQGKFYLPSVAVEAMYDNSIYANKAGRWVEVVKE